MTTPERLAAFRERMKWTQRLCARYLSVDQTTWIGWERGKAGPSVENAKALRAMLALAETDAGRGELAAWASDAEARRISRRIGRQLKRQ
jgi:transcriptional regulator with XRE-family HTH domain